jgi:hypothetical protein
MIFNSQLPDILIESYENNPFFVVALYAVIIRNIKQGLSVYITSLKQNEF